MKTQSAKAKGRRFQQEVRDLLLKYAAELTENDVRSTSMGASGEDILLSEAALKRYPFAIECKNQEKLNVWKAFEQAKENSTETQIPLLLFKRNRSTPMVALEFETLLKLLEKKNEL